MAVREEQNHLNDRTNARKGEKAGDDAQCKWIVKSIHICVSNIDYLGPHNTTIAAPEQYR